MRLAIARRRFLFLAGTFLPRCRAGLIRDVVCDVRHVSCFYGPYLKADLRSGTYLKVRRSAGGHAVYYEDYLLGFLPVGQLFAEAQAARTATIYETATDRDGRMIIRVNMTFDVPLGLPPLLMI